MNAFKLNRHTLWILFYALAIGTGAMADSNSSSPEVPIRRAVVLFNDDEMESFFKQMRAFSERNSFAIRIAPTSPNGREFVLELWREDLKIIAANPFDVGTFKFGIYNILGEELDERCVDEVLNELRKFALNVNSATFETEN